jgi:pimeloyl-ACP methyl ester carboxylesterase
MTWQHHHADLGDVRIHYVTAGAGDAIVLLHGWPQTWYCWRNVIRLLADRAACQNCRASPVVWRFSAVQAVRRYSLITPPRTRCRRIGALSSTTVAASWLGGRWSRP